METIYLIMLAIIVCLSIADLVVGVSNDAVNFLNSAVGSKAFSLRSILIVASIGIFVGAGFSSGMMEVARKGIFNPGEFYFDEIMIVFTAVMLADVLLLDFFNTLGLPTSTTVSIVFDLLGASVAVAFLKLNQTDGNIANIINYINSDKVGVIIVAIFLSVALAFAVGSIVQYISRLIFSFQYEKKLKHFGAVFGGMAFTAITFFIFLKGMHDMPFISASAKDFITHNTLLIVGGSFAFWTLLSFLMCTVFKINILKAVIAVGTFALALAFAGNDLVNFIGVPIAALQSFNLWADSGVGVSQFVMTGLAGEVATPTYLLLIAGVIMVLALWFSKKARHVMATELNLSRQSEGKEKFRPNFLSRVVVRYSIRTSKALGAITPKGVGEMIDAKFQKPQFSDTQKNEVPMFDLVRASVNLVVASILIAIGTSYKLPLSTTYVTFMVAMGTSLADRAWDRESAVYRVAGVFNVIGGWFVTAIGAFLTAAIFAVLIWFGGITAVIILAGLAFFLMIRSAVVHARKTKKQEQAKRLNKQDISTINEITLESSATISNVIRKSGKRYDKVINHLGYQDLVKLKKDTKKLKKIESEVEELKDNVFDYIKNLPDDSVEASKFYILCLDYLENMVEPLREITQASYEHVNNNHKNLTFTQIRELKKMSFEITYLFKEIVVVFETQSFEKIEGIIENKISLSDDVSLLIQKQIRRVRTTESSRKNTKLYFATLLKTRELLAATLNLLHLFNDFYDEARKQL